MSTATIRTVAFLAGLVFLVGPISTSVAGSKFDKEGCRYGQVGEDYGLPLRQIKPVQRPPGEDGQLPFAPPGTGVTLRLPPVPTVLPGGGAIGFELAQTSGKPVELNWRAVNSLSLVRRDGRVSKVLRARHLAGWPYRD